MEILTMREFNGVQLVCYKADKKEDGFWATREQIGQLLGYVFPREAIGKIHERNKDRLNKFSSEVKLTTEAGERIATIYNFKGLLEICRYSNQPKANAVIDLVWNIMDEIYRTGFYVTANKFEEITADPLNVRARVAEVLQRLALITSSEEERQEIIREAFKFATGRELPQKTSTQAYTTKFNKYWTAQQIGKYLKWPPDAIMFRAENLGIMKKPRNGYWDGETWYFSKDGRKKFLELVEQKIVKIKDGIATYEDGHTHVHWDFDPDAYVNHA